MSGVALVTGAAGFIGRWSVPELLARGYEVHAVIRAHAPKEVEGAVIHACDLLDPMQVSELLQKVRATHLLHFAWNAMPGLYWTTPENYAWVAGSLGMLRDFQRMGGKRAVIAGSCAEYDWSRADICREDESPTVLSAGAPAALPYPVCKAALQCMAAAYGRQEKLSVAWGRIFFQYGPYEHPQRLVSSVIASLLQGQEALCTHGRQRRSFMHSTDVGAAFAALLDHGIEGVVNIGDPQEITLAEVVEMIAGIVGRPDLVRLGARPAPPNEPALLLPDTDRLYREVGFRRRETLQSGLEKAVGWWRQELQH